MRIKGMSLRARLLLLLLLVGIVPLAVVGTVALQKTSVAMRELSSNQLVSVRDIKRAQIDQYLQRCEADMDVLVDNVETLRLEAFKKLTAVRETKRAAVERYFQTIRNQIITFSEDQMIVDAARDFRVAFDGVMAEGAWSAEEQARMREELLTYYTGPFASKYQDENTGASPHAERFLAQLDPESVALQYHFIQDNPHPLGEKHLLDRPEKELSYSALHAKVHPIVRSYLERFGYYDIFIVHPETGDIIYSVFKELDYSTSLVDGPYAQTNFGEAFRAANAATSKDSVVLVDYERYTPSYEAPASFIASPIFDGDEKIAVAIFQMPIDRLNQIMSERAGLGETGETYLIGSDLLMRSDSYLDPAHHTVATSFADPSRGSVDTEAGNAALAGQTDARVHHRLQRESSAQRLLPRGHRRHQLGLCFARSMSRRRSAPRTNRAWTSSRSTSRNTVTTTCSSSIRTDSASTPSARNPTITRISSVVNMPTRI